MDSSKRGLRARSHLDNLRSEESRVSHGIAPDTRCMGSVIESERNNSMLNGVFLQRQGLKDWYGVIEKRFDYDETATGSAPTAGSLRVVTVFRRLDQERKVHHHMTWE
jgi:hypothetical protein